MRKAAEALQERLRILYEDALLRADPHAAYYADRIQYATDLMNIADPDDIFEQDAFRKLFTAELRDLG